MCCGVQIFATLPLKILVVGSILLQWHAVLTFYPAPLSKWQSIPICLSLSSSTYLTPIYFISLSTQSTHLNFGLPAFPLLTGFPTNSFLTLPSSDLLPRRTVPLGFVTFIYVPIFSYFDILPLHGRG